MARGALPTGREITRSVEGKLNFKGGITPNMVPFSMTFSPSTAIMAGKVRKLEMDVRSFHEPLLRSIREVMVQSIRENFNSGGRPKWEPLSAASLEVRSHWGNANADPLIWTGKLRSAASQISIWTITKNSAMIRDLPDRAWYGVIHQQGYGGSAGAQVGALSRSGGSIMSMIRTGASRGVQPTHSIPARPFIVLQPEDETAIEQVFIEWLGQRVRKAWS